MLEFLNQGRVPLVQRLEVLTSVSEGVDKITLGEVIKEADLAFRSWCGGNEFIEAAL